MIRLIANMVGRHPLAVLAVLAAVPLLLTGQSLSNASPTEDQIREEMVDLDFERGPAPLREAAQRIAAGDVPDAETLRALGGEIDRSYPNGQRTGQTLLTVALHHRNLGAIDALLAAGADPLAPVDPDSPGQARYWNFLFLAMTDYGVWIESEDRYDMSFVNAVLALYLKHGGDPGHALEHGSSLLGLTVSPGNPEGFAMLLYHGADPWTDGGHLPPLPITLIARSSTIANPFIRLLIENGFYDDLTQDQMDQIVSGATRQLQMGVRADPAEMAPLFYRRFGEYADLMKMLIERTQYALPQETELYRLLYIDDRQYRL